MTTTTVTVPFTGNVIKLPTNANDWEIYSSMRGAGLAAHRLTKALTKALLAPTRDGAILRAASGWRWSCCSFIVVTSVHPKITRSLLKIRPAHSCRCRRSIPAPAWCTHGAHHPPPHAQPRQRR